MRDEDDIKRIELDTNIEIQKIAVLVAKHGMICGIQLIGAKDEYAFNKTFSTAWDAEWVV